MFNLPEKSFREKGIFFERNDEIHAALLKAIARKKIGNRPGRQELRVVKRRPKAFPRVQKARHLYRKQEIV